MELFGATSPFANHQLTTVPVCAQNFSSNASTYDFYLRELLRNELTYLLNYLLTND